MRFPETIAAQTTGRAVRCDVLVEFDFLTGKRRLWNGFGPLDTHDGKRWEGIAGIGGIQGLQQAVNGAAPALSFSVSGVDAGFAARAKGDRDNWFMRPVLCFLQFFDTDDWQVLDSPFAIAKGRLRQLKPSRVSTDTGFVYSVAIQAEGPFITRKRPRYGFYTDRDQQKRFPGDRGCERTAGIENKNIVFPDY